MQLAFEQYGNGNPIIFLHAFPFNRNMWQPQIEFFVSKNFKLIVPDLPGFGESQTTSQINKMEKIAISVAELTDSLRIKKASICGISMGGYVALNLFRLFPKKFSFLILCDTNSTADSEEIRNNRFRLIEKIEKNGMKAVSDSILEKLLSEHTLKNNKSLVEKIHNQILNADKLGTIAALKGMAKRMDHTFILNKINLPTLLIFGEDDKITDLKTAEKLNNQIPNSKIKIIKNCGHLSNLEKPTEFNIALAEFLNETT